MIFFNMKYIYIYIYIYQSKILLTIIIEDDWLRDSAKSNNGYLAVFFKRKRLLLLAGL